MLGRDAGHRSAIDGVVGDATRRVVVARRRDSEDDAGGRKVVTKAMAVAWRSAKKMRLLRRGRQERERRLSGESKQSLDNRRCSLASHGQTARVGKGCLICAQGTD